MASFLGPDWVQLNYTSNGHTHRALLPCKIAGTPTPGIEPELVLRSASDQLVSDAVDLYCTTVKAFFKATDSFDNFYVFHQPTPEDPPTLIWAGEIDIVGTNGGATAPGSEIVLSYKTPSPGGLKLYLMEGVTILNFKEALPGPDPSPERDITEYILGASNWIIGRNGEQPLVGINLVTKLNDHLRKKYLL